ncbi:diguanylate cyclase [Clostridium sp. CS001]|uniref:diguanylate cyclase n=1 Tax=Clostridium sp. CS001 TaxID=2880648 RepID=UPI001CF4ECDB|nr:diguanylate cyclase [Clostridium sp. CS001]MCB2289287.1 diguanylate cyclase [Clostridium sp. CS001]
MNLINNRYRVIKSLTQDRIKSSYLVSDVVNNHEKVQLNIINSEFAAENLISYFIAEFITFPSIDHENISKVFDFGFIRIIDNSKIKNGEYFYTNDYIGNTEELQEVMANICENNILDIFMQLCMALNYLHIKGFVYGEFNTNNIMIVNKGNKNKVILKDLPTIEIQKQDYGHSKLGQKKFKAPGQIVGKNPTIASDIYSMGVVLLALCKIDINERTNIQQDILKLENRVKIEHSNSISTLEFYNNIIKIIKKMTNEHLSNRYDNINEIVKDVNEFFNTEYKAYIIDEIEKLNFNTKIVGRNVEVTKIISAYEDLVNRSTSNGIIFVQGEQGIGKTRLLKEIEHLLYMRKANIFSSFAIENFDSSTKSNKAIIDILKKVVAVCDEEIVKRYQNELIKLIPDLGKESNVVASESLIGEKEKYRLISRIYSFIEESINNKPTIFIIDNANCLDEFSMELLEYINMQSYNDQNIMIVLSYTKGKNDRFEQLLNKGLNNIRISLNNFNNEETSIMIQGILGMPWVPSEFGEKIYGKTYGNPLFIEETLKDFAAKKILGINVKHGKWYTPFETLDEMPIASTMEQALLNQIKEIDQGSYEVLSTISIFNTAISIEVIEKLFIDNDVRIENYVNELCAKGILCRKIEDRGFVFDFNNKVLKNLIYDKLSENQRKAKHEIASSVLEKLFEVEKKGSKEELIYHLEKAKDVQRTVKYCIELAEEMKSLRIMDEAISKYKKALSMLASQEDLNKKVEILLKIGDIYVSVGNLSAALESYKKPYEYSMNLVEEKLQVDTANKVAYICMKKNEMEEAVEYIEKGETILSNIEYMEGYLENRKLLANLYMSKREYQKVIGICNYSIDKCGDNYLKYKGLLYNILGVMYSETSRKIQALEHYRKALKYFEEINNPEGMCICLNNLGVIYGDHYQERETAISYYNKILVICKENNIVESEIIALINLAVCNIDNFHYDAAFKYLKDVLEKSTNMGLEGNVFYTYNYLSYVCLKMGNIKESYEYNLLAQGELEQHPIQGKDISLFYQMGAELYYAIGNIDEAYILVKKAIEICNNDGTTQDNNSKLLLFILEIQRAKNLKDINKKIKHMNIVINSFKNNIDKVNVLYEICISLYENGYIKVARSLFKTNTLSKQEISSEVIKLKGLYLKGLLYEDKIKINNLMEALDLCKRLRNKIFQWRICNAIGDYYFSQDDYFYAVNYHFEACEIIKDCTLQLPEEVRVKYINSWNRMKPFDAIKYMSKSYPNSKGLESTGPRTIILNQKELKNLFHYNTFAEILNNKSFIESSKKIYRTILPKDIYDINDIIVNMCEEPLDILDTVTKLVSSIVLSTRSLVISEGSEEEYSILASSDGNQDITHIKPILQRVRETKNSILVSEAFNSGKDIELRFMPSGMKSIMCIPILKKEHCSIEMLKVESRSINELFKTESIKGYLYMESERVLNNFNEESLNKCGDLTSFISFVMENYLLKISSSIDKLTGTLTRRFLEDALSQQIEKANKVQGKFSIIMFDLDNFKGVNDRFGHQTGDQVLRDVCKVVMDSIRKNDVCGRYGGEEFIVILPETDTTLAYEIAERIRRDIEDKKLLGSKRELTVSIGIATYPNHGKWKQELVEKADQALYVAKASGRNRSQIWEEEFVGTVKGTNKLLGIVSGNLVQDSRNILAMSELVEIIKGEDNFETKVFNSLGRIIETTEAHNGMFFMINRNKVTKKFARQIFKEDWTEAKGYSEAIIEAVIIDKQAKCIIDWDSIVDYDIVTGMPNWNSVLVIPIIKSGIVYGILYLTVPIKVKEFKIEDLNFTSMLGQLLIGVF